MDYLKNILDKYNISITLEDILDRWSEPQRFYHNKNHLFHLLNCINRDKYLYDDLTYNILVLSALFHDIVYEPTRNDNEELSSELFNNVCKDISIVGEVTKIILDTKHHESDNRLSIIFNDYDMNIVLSDYKTLIKWEEGIYNEYKCYGDDKYKIGRLNFLNSIVRKYPQNRTNLIQLIDYVESKY